MEGYHISYLYCTFPELEIGREAPTTGGAKAQPQRNDTSPSRMGSTRIPGFAKAVTVPHLTPRIPLSLNLHKGLWSQNQLASSSPTPGKPLTVLHEPCHMVSAGARTAGVQPEQDPYFTMLLPGSLPQGHTQLSPGMEESDQRHTGEYGEGTFASAPL